MNNQEGRANPKTEPMVKMDRSNQAPLTRSCTVDMRFLFSFWMLYTWCFAITPKSGTAIWKNPRKILEKRTWSKIGYHRVFKFQFQASHHYHYGSQSHSLLQVLPEPPLHLD